MAGDDDAVNKEEEEAEEQNEENENDDEEEDLEEEEEEAEKRKKKKERSLWQRIKDLPEDLFRRYFEEELAFRDLWQREEKVTSYVAVLTLYVVHFLCRWHAGQNWFEFFLLALSIGNCAHLFVLSRKSYHLFNRNTLTSPSTTARLVVITTDDREAVGRSWWKRILYKIKDYFFPKKLPNDETLVWELMVWNPSKFSLNVFCFYSPAHCLMMILYARMEGATWEMFFLLVIADVIMIVLLLVTVKKFEELLRDKQLMFEECYKVYADSVNRRVYVNHVIPDVFPRSTAVNSKKAAAPPPQPPMNPEEIQRKVDHAYSHGVASDSESERFYTPLTSPRTASASGSEAFFTPRTWASPLEGDKTTPGTQAAESRTRSQAPSSNPFQHRRARNTPKKEKSS